MDKYELTKLLNSTQNNDENDISFKLLKFLIDNYNLTKSKYSDKIKNKSTWCTDGIYILFNDDEYIRTNGSEVPKKNGGWWYNGDSTYEFLYILIENNKLLVIEFEDSNNDDPYFSPKVSFRLYPIKDEYTIKTIPGHRKEPYLSIIDDSGNQVIDDNGFPINTFSFEYITDNKAYNLNGKHLKDVLPAISIKELIKRYQEGIKIYQEGIIKHKKLLDEHKGIVVHHKTKKLIPYFH